MLGVGILAAAAALIRKIINGSVFKDTMKLLGGAYWSKGMKKLSAFWTAFKAGLTNMLSPFMKLKDLLLGLPKWVAPVTAVIALLAAGFVTM